jgi:hypothetical protein
VVKINPKSPEYGAFNALNDPFELVSRCGTAAGLTGLIECSTFVLMQVARRGAEPWLEGAHEVHMRCANGYRLGTRSMRRCVYRKRLDLETLVGYARAELAAVTTRVAAQVSSLWESTGHGGV